MKIFRLRLKIAALMLISLLFVPTAGFAADTVFSDDFDNYPASVEVAPDLAKKGWNYNQTDDKTTFVRVLEDDTRGGNVLKFYDTARSTPVIGKNITFSDRYAVEMWLKTPETTLQKRIVLRNGTGSNFLNLLSMRVGGLYTLDEKVPLEGNILFEPDTWFHARFIIDVEAYAYKVFINDRFAGEFAIPDSGLQNIDFSTNTSIRVQLVGQGSAEQPIAIYLDDFSIYPLEVHFPLPKAVEGNVKSDRADLVFAQPMQTDTLIPENLESAQLDIREVITDEATPNRCTVVYNPVEYNSSYSIRLKDSVKDMYGRSGEMGSCIIRTGPGVSIINAQNTGVDKVELLFEQEIDVSSLTAEGLRAGGIAVKQILPPTGEKKSYTVVFNGQLVYETSYTLQFLIPVIDKNGMQITGEIPFSTMRGPVVVNGDYADTREIEVLFPKKLNPSTVTTNHIQIEGVDLASVWLKEDGQTCVLKLQEPLQYDTPYQIIFTQGLLDENLIPQAGSVMFRTKLQYPVMIKDARLRRGTGTESTIANHLEKGLFELSVQLKNSGSESVDTIVVMKLFVSGKEVSVSALSRKIEPGQETSARAGFLLTDKTKNYSIEINVMDREDAKTLLAQTISVR